MSKTKKVSKKVKILILILFEFYAISDGVVQFILRLGSPEVVEKSDTYPALLTAYILLSLLYLFLAWFMERILGFLAAHAKQENRFLTSEFLRLLLTYLCILSPTVFGGMLLDQGLHLSQYLYFVGMSIVIALVWGIYDLRKKPVPELVEE